MNREEMEEEWAAKQAKKDPVEHGEDCCKKLPPSKPHPIGFYPSGFGGFMPPPPMILVDIGDGKMEWRVITEDGRALPADEFYY